MKINANVRSKSLANKLDKAATKNIPKAVKSSIDEALIKVQAKAKEKHKFHSRTGTLINAIRTATNGNNAGSVFIDVSSAPYAPFVVNGFQSFRINVFDKPMHWTNGGQDFFAYGVTHPGKQADKFLTAALDNTRADINKIFSAKLRKESGLWRG